MSDNFDPMTGEPIKKEQEPKEADEEMAFDPMTGEPIKKELESDAAETVTGEVMHFDPMTGEMIGQPVYQEEMNFDPMTGKPIKSKSRKKILFAAIGAAAAILVVFFVCMANGVFLGKSQKILLAVRNTVSEENRLAESLTKTKIVNSDSYTMGGEMEISGQKMEFVCTSSKDEKQVRGTVNADGVDVDFYMSMDGSKLCIQIPAFSDEIFTYYYKENNTGYLIDLMEQSGIDVDDFNSALEKSFSQEEQQGKGKEYAKLMLEEFDSIEVKSLGKEMFEVDNKNRSCKGYGLTITDKNVLNILELFEDFYEDMYDGMEDAMGTKYLFSQMRQEIRDMPDIDLEFFLYKNKLACVRMEMDREEMEIRFLGGDFRMQNVEVLAEDDTVLEWAGSASDSVENYKLYVDGVKAASLEYQHKSGDIMIDAEKELGFYLEGNISSDKNELTVDIDDMLLDEEECSGRFYVKNGAEIEELKGSEFDIGNASQREIQELMMEIYQGQGLYLDDFEADGDNFAEF